MRTSICALCGSPHAEEREYSKAVQRGGKHVEVHGLRHYVCLECEADFVDDQQSRHNLLLVQAAFGEEGRYLSGRQIREWREHLGLTQRLAARIFGGGLNAFSKYETGEVIQSEAMDNLLWLVMRMPSLIPVLASRHNVPLPEGVSAKCTAWSTIKSSWQSSVQSISRAPLAHASEGRSEFSIICFLEPFQSYRNAVAEALAGDHWVGVAESQLGAANAQDFRLAENA